MATTTLSRALQAQNRSKAMDHDEIKLPADRAKFFYSRAKLLYRAGGNCSVILERVAACIIKAISFAPMEVKYFLFLAKIFHASLDFSSCLYCLRYALKLSPHLPIARQRIAMVLYQLGHEALCEAIASKTKEKSMFSKARAYFDECLKHEILSKKIWILKAICHIYMDELPAALEAVKRIIRPNKTIPAELYILRAKLLWAQGLIAQGNMDLNLAKMVEATHPEVAAFSTRIFVESERYFHSCLRSLEEGDYQSALSQAKHALSIARDDIKLHCLLAKVHRLKGDVKAAYTAIQVAANMFRKATSSDQFDVDLPDDVILQTNLIFNEMAIGYAAKGDYDRAIAVFNKIIRIEQDRCSRRATTGTDIRYYINRADCFRALGRTDDAMNGYNEALKLKPNDINVKTKMSLCLYTLAVEAFNKSDFVTCEKLFTKAIELNARVSEYFLSRGKARYHLGKFADAYNDFKVAQNLNPTNDEVTAQLAQFLEDRSVVQKEFVDSSNKATEKNNNTTSTSTSNGNGNYSGNSNYSGKNTNSNSIILAASASAPALLQQEHGKGTLSTAGLITVSNDDRVQFMLNPKAAKRLPSISQSMKDIEDAAMRRSTTSIQYSELPSPATTLSHVNPKMLAPLAAAVDVAAKEKKVREILTSKNDVERGPLWGLLSSAKEIADRECGRGRSRKKFDIDGMSMAVSAATLKRLSEEQAKKNGKNGIVAGVFSHSKTDPNLNSKRSLLLRLQLPFADADSSSLLSGDGIDDASSITRSSMGFGGDVGTGISTGDGNRTSNRFSRASFGVTKNGGLSTGGGVGAGAGDFYSTRLVIKGQDQLPQPQGKVITARKGGMRSAGSMGSGVGGSGGGLGSFSATGGVDTGAGAAAGGSDGDGSGGGQNPLMNRPLAINGDLSKPDFTLKKSLSSTPYGAESSGSAGNSKRNTHSGGDNNAATANDEFDADVYRPKGRSGLVKLLIESGVSGMWPLRSGSSGVGGAAGAGSAGTITGAGMISGDGAGGGSGAGDIYYGGGLMVMEGGMITGGGGGGGVGGPGENLSEENIFAGGVADSAHFDITTADEEMLDKMLASRSGSYHGSGSSGNGSGSGTMANGTTATIKIPGVSLNLSLGDISPTPSVERKMYAPALTEVENEDDGDY